MKFDGIIFDLDGTLWDSCQVVAESWECTLRNDYGAESFPTADDIMGVMGTTAAQIAEAIFSPYGERAMEVCLKCIEDECIYVPQLGGGIIYPCVEDMLRRLSERLPLFIVSNCKDGYIQCFLEFSGFGRYIKDFECEGSTGLTKGENIKLISTRHGLEHPVYLGDTHSDEKSAKSAGAYFVHAAYGFGKSQSPDAVAHSPENFMNFILEEIDNV